MSPRRLVLTASALAVLLAGCGGSAATGTGAAAPDPTRPAHAAAAQEDAGAARTLVIGSVSDDAEEESAAFQPFANHAAAELADAGITAGKVKVASTVEDMVELLRRGQVDLYVDSMYGVTRTLQAEAGTPLLRRWKDGEPTYHSVIVARRDSGIRAPEDLVGKAIAFEEDRSTDSYFLPITTLRERGFRVEPLDRPDSPVPAGDIGFVFSGDDENTVFYVLSGRVEAGALSEEDLAENAGDRVDELKVIARTIDVPRHGVVASRTLTPELRRRIEGTLLRMHESPEGRVALEQFDDTAKFDSLTPRAMQPVLRLAEKLDGARP